MADTKLSGLEKISVILMYLGEELASEVVKHLSDEELQLIGGTMIKKDSVSMVSSKRVVDEFLGSMGSDNITVQGMQYAQNLINNALGPEKGEAILEQIKRQMGGSGLESLRWMDPGVVANTLKSEHPQIVALILALLDPDTASSILIQIPEERVRGEVMLRVATLKTIPQAAVSDLEEMLNKQMFSDAAGAGSNVEGVKLAAEILNQVDAANEEKIMETLESTSGELAEAVQAQMFVFADLNEVDDRGMQSIIKELSTEILSVSLKGVDEGLRDKFYKNMSERAADMLQEDIEAMGPVRVSDIEKNQQEILKIARKLEGEGKLVRAGRGGDLVV
ncbi:MAG: flagellar motor switch protein FliG [Proteobacteria bacterium]|nr:flagellar motor switch protein FliG [Pseudomonadota bacterium]